jgi:tRNA(Ile)-lysidine synthase
VSPLAVEVPLGRWAVAVSGGADSVALLLLLCDRPDLSLHVVHLDHQLRGPASTADASFVADLSARLSVPATIVRRDQIEPDMPSLPKNLSARYRAIRIEFFRRVVERDALLGVIFAHQADDQAETILLRLLRGSGPLGLAGMSPRARIAGLTVLRPLLETRRSDLRSFLTKRDQPWREDASNQSDAYARNRVRKFLDSHPDLHEPLLVLGRSCSGCKRWIAENSPHLAQKFPAKALADLPRMLGRESARRWLASHSASAADLTPEVLDRLRGMAADAATPATFSFPANLRVHRRRGWISRD